LFFIAGGLDQSLLLATALSMKISPDLLSIANEVID
jgi:hypothetical protein